MLVKDVFVFDPCPPARKWLEENSGKSPEELWNLCPQGDWLLWLAGHNPRVDRVLLVRAGAGCARLALRHVPTGEDRPRLAVEAAERYAESPTAGAAAWAAEAAEAAWAARAARAAEAAEHAKCADIVRSIIPFDLFR